MESSLFWRHSIRFILLVSACNILSFSTQECYSGWSIFSLAPQSSLHLRVDEKFLRRIWHRLGPSTFELKLLILGANISHIQLVGIVANVSFKPFLHVSRIAASYKRLPWCTCSMIQWFIRPTNAVYQTFWFIHVVYDVTIWAFTWLWDIFEPCRY